MRLTSRDNLAEVEAAIDRIAERVAVARYRAANALSDVAERAGFRQISTTYQIPVRTMEQYASQRYATSVDLTATITVKGRGFPLSTFKPVPGPKGTSVVIKGRRILIPHAFMVGKFGRHVFARGSYGGKYGGTPTGEAFGRFTFTRQRLPIAELYSFAPPDAFANPATVEAMDQAVEERAQTVLARELASVARGF